MDASGTFEGLTELDALFGGVDEDYVSNIRLADGPVMTSTEKILR